MSDHLDYIRIRGLIDSETESFQGSGAYGEPIAPIKTKPTLAEQKQEIIDLKALWEAQQKFTANLIGYLNSLDPQSNSDFGSLVSDYAGILSACANMTASMDALRLQASALEALPVLWKTIDRQPSEEVTKWIETADTWGKNLEKWFEDGIAALYAKDEALDAIDAAKALLADAKTEEDVAAAQSALSTAEEDLATAEGRMIAAQSELPGDSASPMPGLIELITIARALMTGDLVLVAITLIRIAIPLGIEFLVKWIGGKLPGRKAPPTQAELRKIADAIEDVALKDAIIKFGENAALHVKGQLLRY